MGTLPKRLPKILGSHNTMSYLAPKSKWLKFINRHFAQCQDKPLDRQVAEGVRCFDLRVYWHNGTMSWRFAHGRVDYDLSVGLGDALLQLSNLLGRKKAYVRLILEKETVVENAPASYSEFVGRSSKLLFKDLCGMLEKTHPEWVFFGGRLKDGWELVYDFEANNGLPVSQWVGSMAADAKPWERIMPRAYAKRAPRHKLNGGVNLVDFV